MPEPTSTATVTIATAAAAVPALTAFGVSLGLRPDLLQVPSVERDDDQRPSCTTTCGMIATTVIGIGRSLTMRICMVLA